jgi:virulence-associated protein VapD
MVKDLNIHDRIVQALKDLAEAYPQYSKVMPYLSKREPILIPFETCTVKYYPDLWAETKKLKRVDVYEVWHTESEDQAIADMYLCAKTPNLLNVCIVCVKTRSDSWTKDYAKNIVDTVLKDLENRYTSLKSIRTQGHIYLAEVGRNELRTDATLRASLSKQFEF